MGRRGPNSGRLRDHDAINLVPGFIDLPELQPLRIDVDHREGVHIGDHPRGIGRVVILLVEPPRRIVREAGVVQLFPARAGRSLYRVA